MIVIVIIQLVGGRCEFVVVVKVAGSGRRGGVLRGGFGFSGLVGF